MHETVKDIKRFLRNYAQIWSGQIYLENDLIDPETIHPPTAANKSGNTARPARFNNQNIPAQKSPELQELYLKIKDCSKCSLHGSRKNFVFGFGNPKASLMLIGEAPGRDEDEKGIPFVGKAGQLLEKMLLAIGTNRDEVFIANMLKCRPPQNRDPLPDEIMKCEPYLLNQLDIIKPKVLVALGRVSGQNLLKSDNSLSDLRNQTHMYKGTPLIVTYHPAALLRNPRWKYNSWQDLKKIKKLIQDTPPT